MLGAHIMWFVVLMHVYTHTDEIIYDAKSHFNDFELSVGVNICDKEVFWSDLNKEAWHRLHWWYIY